MILRRPSDDIELSDIEFLRKNSFGKMKSVFFLIFCIFFQSLAKQFLLQSDTIDFFC